VFCKRHPPTHSVSQADGERVIETSLEAEAIELDLGPAVVNGMSSWTWKRRSSVANSEGGIRYVLWT